MSAHVLVADASSASRRIVVRSLIAAGAGEVVEATDGVSAYDRFQEESFDLAVIEWKLPLMSGLELLEKIRTIDQDVPVVMLGARPERERIFAAIEAGATDYLVKPFDAEAFRSKLDRYVAA